MVTVIKVELYNSYKAINECYKSYSNSNQSTSIHLNPKGRSNT